MELSEILKNMNQATPAHFLPYIEENNGVWRLSMEARQLRASELLELYSSPVFKLLNLEDPRLKSLNDFAEVAYLKGTASDLTQRILSKVRPKVREWCMPLVEDVMKRRGRQLHPFISVIWGGRMLWPYLSNGPSHHKQVQTHDWVKLFKCGCGRPVTDLEHYTLHSIVALQYKDIDAYNFMTTVGAYVRSFRPDVNYMESYPDDNLPRLRGWLEARKHLLSYVENNTPLNPEILWVVE